MDQRRRGYILIEVAVGGAILAVAIFGLMGSLAEARTRNVIGGRDVIASQLALDKVEMQRALGYGNTATGCNAGEVIQNQGVYTRDCSVTTPAAVTMFGITRGREQISVTVTYSTSLGDRAVTVVSEVYQCVTCP